MLFAGTTSFLNKVSFKYSILNDIVIKLKQWSLSAGNKFIKLKHGTSETLCNETVEVLENVKEISVHVPRHLKPNTPEQLGHYLAGLIEGGGHFTNKQELVIEFHPLDASLAYFIKKSIGYGRVKKIKREGKESIFLVVSSIEGLIKVINLINGKIRIENTLNEMTKNILNDNKFAFSEFNNKLPKELKLNLDKNLKNHWLAGFSDATASFQIKFVNKSHPKLGLQLNFHIELAPKDNILFALQLIKEFLGGNIAYNNNNETYNYDSTSFGSAKNVIDYLDHYHLLSSKQVNFLKWRKSYIIIQNKDYLNENGINKIIKFKNTLINYND